MSPFQEILKILSAPRPSGRHAVGVGLTSVPMPDSGRGRDRDDVAVGCYALCRPSDFGKQIRVPAQIANDNERPAVGI